MNLIHYKDNCRLCLKTHTYSMKNIFTYCIEGYKETVAQNIFSLFKLKLIAHKEYSQLICRKCLIDIESILLFNEDLQRNQDFLLDLFRKAYPNCIKKNVTVSRNFYESSHVDLDSNTSVNQNTMDLCTNVNTTEYIKAPLNSLKQMGPKVHLKKYNSHICIYCKKMYKCKGQLNFHLKKEHKVLVPHGEFTPLVEMKGENVVQSIPEDTINQQLCDMNSAFPLAENQASFLQNFNLIAKEEAETMKTVQVSSTGKSSRRHRKNIREHAKSLNKKPTVKTATKFRRFKAKKVKTTNELGRSIKFLERYGCRKLPGRSRRTSTVHTLGCHKKMFELLDKRTVSAKLSKVAQKLQANVRGFKTENNNKGCEFMQKLHTLNPAQSHKVANDTDKVKSAQYINKVLDCTKDKKIIEDSSRTPINLTEDAQKLQDIKLSPVIKKGTLDFVGSEVIPPNSFYSKYKHTHLNHLTTTSSQASELPVTFKQYSKQKEQQHLLGTKELIVDKVCQSRSQLGRINGNGSINGKARKKNLGKKFRGNKGGYSTEAKASDKLKLEEKNLDSSLKCRDGNTVKLPECAKGGKPKRKYEHEDSLTSTGSPLIEKKTLELNVDLHNICNKPSTTQFKTLLGQKHNLSRSNTLISNNNNIPEEKKPKALHQLQDLHEHFEMDKNKGLRIKMRKTESCEDLNNLKINIQTVEHIPDYKETPSKYVPDIISTSIKDVNAMKLKTDTPSSKKIITLNVEDVEMQILVSTDAELSFDDDDITKYISGGKLKQNLEDTNFPFASKYIPNEIDNHKDLNIYKRKLRVRQNTNSTKDIQSSSLANNHKTSLSPSSPQIRARSVDNISHKSVNIKKKNI